MSSHTQPSPDRMDVWCGILLMSEVTAWIAAVTVTLTKIAAAQLLYFCICCLALLSSRGIDGVTSQYGKGVYNLTDNPKIIWNNL